MPNATIYLIKCNFPIHYEDGSFSYSYKIGHSLDFKRRIGSLREHCPFALHIVFTISVPSKLARKCERALHIRYKSCLARIVIRDLANKSSKEWFVFNDEIKSDVISHMKEMEQGIMGGGWDEYVQREVNRNLEVLRAS